MAYVWKATISIATTSSGNHSAYSTGIFNGYIQAVAHSAASAQMSTACAFTLATESGLTVLELAAASSAWQRYPRLLASSSSGGASTDAARWPAPVCNERLLVTLTSQATSTGCSESFTVFIGG